EAQFPVTSLNDNLTNPTLDGLYGVSGPGNLFKPGTLTGTATQFNLFKQGSTAYKTDKSNFAPSLGLAWTPDFKGGMLGRLFGGGGQTVLRGGFSMAFNRDGINTLIGTVSGNTGGSITVNRNTATAGTLPPFPFLFRNVGALPALSFPDTPSYPLTAAITNAGSTYDPNLKTPYIMSWTFGVQREITKDTVIEARYVGNRALNFRQSFNLNEINIVENGFLNEFKLAQANLQANLLVPTAQGGGAHFRYRGPGTGTSPLPITLAYFSGRVDPNAAASYTSTNFASATFINTLALNNAAPTTFASSLYTNATFRTNAANAGLPVNLFLTNPGLQGGASFLGNGGHS
ncbi:MAG TPA: hypothetical protein PLQ88_32520, partial [Blastocatellia bacterium]|nr:hypothetical protein [Blastocatellia bacterium]